MQLEPHQRFFDPRAVAAERRLWHVLRDRRLHGFDFARTVSLGAFEVDFFCADAGVAIEIDGAHHDQKPAAKAPPHGVLERAGLVVMRFTVDDVLHRFGPVTAAVVAACNSRLRARVGRGPPSQ